MVTKVEIMRATFDMGGGPKGPLQPLESALEEVVRRQVTTLQLSLAALNAT
jgi:hypothetical protein